MRYFDFFQWAWPILNPGQPLRANWHLELLCEELETAFTRLMAGEDKLHDLIINVPPASGKSSIVSIMAHPWLWTQRPQMRIIGGSYSLALSTSHALRSRDLILSDEYQERWGSTFALRRDRARATAYANNQTGERISTSTGAGITGRHADLLLIDDPISPHLAASRKGLQRCTDWYDHTLSTRTTNRAVALRILVMQRLHDNDLTGYLLRRWPHRYRHICLPAELTPAIAPGALASRYQQGLLDPVRFPRKVLDDLRADLGAWAYGGQILQSPAPLGGGLLKRKWFGTYSTLPADAVWHVVVDPAYTAKTYNDPSALMAYAYADGHWYIREVAAEWLEFPKLLRYLADFALRNGYGNGSCIRVEPKASGKDIVNTLRRQSTLNIIEGPNPEGDKIARVLSIAAIVESGRILLPETGYPWKLDFLDECTLFPNGQHDDRVDCLVMAIDAHKTAPRPPVEYQLTQIY